MKHTWKNRLLAMLLAVCAVLSMELPAQAATIADGSKTCTVHNDTQYRFLSTTAGNTVGGGHRYYKTNDGITGPAYCIDWGLAMVPSNKQLSISRYTSSPKTIGAFVSGYPQCTLEDFLELHLADNPALKGLTEDEYAYATQVAVWATLGQLGVQGTSFTAGRATIAKPANDAQKVRVYTALSIVLRLANGWDIIVIDAEREYSDLIRAMGGAVIEISPSSSHHINPLEIARGYGVGENPVAMKSELLMSICEQQMGVGQLGAFHKSIIDRCTANVYHDFVKSGGKARQPVLADWRNEVKRQPEREAEELALASELFVEGSLNMFAHETNADISNRMVSFDLYEMGEQLKPTALNVTMETIQNRVAANRLAGRYTWVFIDEIYLFFKYYYSAQFLYKCWKRFRKYGAAMTGATQNVEECLRSDTARLMFANSEFLVLLNQAPTDRAELARLLNISETQMGHVTSAEAGHGLLRIGSSIVPFANEFPRGGELYRLWNTTPEDK